MNQESDWRTFLEPGPQRIGGKYLKAMYREFTDATFTQRVQRPEWMGFLGPILSGEQGDTIRIVFKNMAYQAGRNFSMHPHGAQYTKENEGETILFACFHRSFHYLPSEPNQAVFSSLPIDHFAISPVSRNRLYLVLSPSTVSLSPLWAEPDCIQLSPHRPFRYLPCGPNQAVFSSLPIVHFVTSPVSRTRLYSVLSP